MKDGKVETVLAIVCPGQGAQTPGLLAPWMDLPGVSDLLTDLSAASGAELHLHGTESDEETIRDTAVAQPLIAAASLICAHALGVNPQKLAEHRDQVMVAGHSVGEIPASALAGVLSPQQAMQLISVRADAMAEAAAAAPTGMSAVLGGKEDEVFESIAAAGLTPANVNGSGQVVAAGSQEALTALAGNPPARARVIPLKVAGAFHTDYMAPARDALAAGAEGASPADPRVPLLSNRDGARLETGAEALDRIIAQVTSPVRWDMCMDSMRSAGVTGILELLPGGTLVGLAKRGLKGVESCAVTSPEDLEAAADFISEHTR